MKCFNHNDRDGFVVCKSCGKALCLECAEKYNGFYICKGSASCRHIADVEYVNYFKDNSIGSWMFNKWAFILIGAFLLLYALLKSFMFFMIPNPVLESLLIVLLSILLIKKGLDLRIK